MKAYFAATMFAALMVSACSGSSNPGPLIVAQNSAFGLAPSEIDLTPDAPTDTFNGQADVANISYTPHGASNCVGTDGSIAVAGDGVAQIDVAGAPLLFVVYAAGNTPPSDCTVTVTGADGSSASVDVTYSVPAINNVPNATTRRPLIVPPVATPTVVTFASLGAVQPVTVSGFGGTITSTVTCKPGNGGVQVTPAQGTSSSTFYIAPYGQGTTNNACTVTLTDANKDKATIAVTLAIGALAKLAVAPTTAQFACAGSTAPTNCQTLASVQVSEAGTPTFKIVTRPTLKGSCANAFVGPLTMTTDGSTFAQSITAAAAAITFAGLLPSPTLACSQIVLTDNNAPAQRARIAIASTLGTPPSSLAAASPPPCSGTDPRVNVPNAPHGMYVWNPWKVKGGIYEPYLESDVIGKDPNLCGVSLVVAWNSIEKNRGVFDWSSIATQAAPYLAAHLTVNLLFADAAEVGTNDTTPQWVTASRSAGGDSVAVVSCSGQPDYPNFMDPVFESDWEDFIAHAVAQYGNDPTIGYMRFAIGFGVEAIPGHLGTYPTDPCSQAWNAVGYSFGNWVTHSKHIVNFLATQQTSKQLMVALNYIPGWSNTLYDYPDDVADVAAFHGIAYGTENLGIGHVADPGTTPSACNTQAKNASIYWCRAFMNHQGKVPYEFQPIEAVIDPLAQYNIDFTNLLQYALVNNTQIFELYPQDWLEADSPLSPVYNQQYRAKWQAALKATALVVGAHKLP